MRSHLRSYSEATLPPPGGRGSAVCRSANSPRSAGWYGLAAAKQYHCIHPAASLAVLDSQAALGGTWAEERLYPGLRSNNLWGTYEYPDFPMDEATFGVGRDEYIPGHVVNRYLGAYAAAFGILDRIRPATRVLVAEHRDAAHGGGWVLTTASAGGPAQVWARKLIVATGLTSDAWLPHFRGQESFGGPVFHGKHFRQHRDTLQTARRVTVFGGAKSSWDAVYAYATAGVEVDWVIRRICPPPRHACARAVTDREASDGPRPLLGRPLVRHAIQAVD